MQYKGLAPALQRQLPHPAYKSQFYLPQWTSCKSHNLCATISFFSKTDIRIFFYLPSNRIFARKYLYCTEMFERKVPRNSIYNCGSFKIFKSILYEETWIMEDNDFEGDKRKKKTKWMRFKQSQHPSLLYQLSWRLLVEYSALLKSFATPICWWNHLNSMNFPQQALKVWKKTKQINNPNLTRLQIH